MLARFIMLEATVMRSLVRNLAIGLSVIAVVVAGSIGLLLSAKYFLNSLYFAW